MKMHDEHPLRADMRWLSHRHASRLYGDSTTVAVPESSTHQP
jgi:hypothetical protein